MFLKSELVYFADKRPFTPNNAPEFATERIKNFTEISVSQLYSLQ